MNRPWPGLAGLILLLLSACADDQVRLERIKAGEPLRVAILASASFYFAGESLIRGLDHDIVSAYATSIQARLQIIPVATPAAIRACLRQGRAHIGIADAMPPPADPRISASAAYAEGEWVVVGGRSQKLPIRLADILHTAPLSAGNERG